MRIDRKELKEWIITILAGVAIFGIAIGLVFIQGMKQRDDASEVRKLTALLVSERLMTTELRHEASRLTADSIFYMNRNEQAIAITKELIAMTREPEGPVYAASLIQTHCDYQEKLLELLDTLEEVWE